jgi:DNA end-binding protein Ku
MASGGNGYDDCMPRAIWSGSLAFGLLNAPVRMYPATSDSGLSFRLLHEPDHGRIGYEKVCKAEGTAVPSDEIVRAYEVSPDEVVVVTDEELDAASRGATGRIDISDFVPYEQIDPLHFEKSYYLGPAKGAEHVYVLLATAMEKSGLAAIGRFVFHGSERLGALRVRDGLIILERLYFAQDIREPADIVPVEEPVDDRELDLARQLIAANATNFDPTRYRDEYRERVLAMVEEKRETGSVRVRTDETHDVEAPDLLEALRRSLEQSPKPPPGPSRAPRSKKSASRR